jgi:hypothetical protein
MTDVKAKIVDLAKEWLDYNRKGDVAGIEILPQQTAQGLIVWFYYEETLEDLPYFLTVPMVKEFQEGKNPKKVKNQYLQRRTDEKS